jgi:2-polyprenyl-3-methyl-5-hydroxy-6-metoxy-1,4-benzoquinol methylase
MHPADRALCFVEPFATAMGPPAAVRLLATVRRAAVDSVLAQYREEAANAALQIGTDTLQTGTGGSDGAPSWQAFADIAHTALGAYHSEVMRRARGLSHAVAAVDRRWHASDKPELLDDPNLDQELRRRIMHRLDHANRTLRSYSYFLDELQPLLRTGEPTTILDLAAGHGGFAIAATELARSRGVELHFTATDLKREYLDMGAAAADKADVDVRFKVQDALDLSNIKPGEYDIILSTQSLHHFPSPLVAVMHDAAARVAGRGVVLIDGCRSALVGTFIGAWGMLHERAWRAFSHDAFTSFRRFFTPEELELLCRLSPLGEGVQVKWTPPGHIIAVLETRPI